MLAVAADWHPRKQTRSPEEIMAVPALAHYVNGWPRADDFGLVAHDGALNLGAAWWRYFPPDDPGHGYVGANIPKISVGVLASARGHGLGRSLMAALIAEAQRRSLPGLSLSVELDNYARRLYDSLGFVALTTNGTAVTMLLSINS